MFLRYSDKDLSNIYSSQVRKFGIINEEEDFTNDPNSKESIQSRNSVKAVDLTKEEFNPVRIRLEKAKELVRKKDFLIWYQLKSLRLVPTIDTARCPRMQVDRFGNIFVNVIFMMQDLDLESTAFVLAHEALHIMNFTFKRKMGRDHDIWNRATDYAMNKSLLISGFKAPIPPEGTAYCVPTKKGDKWFVIHPFLGWEFDITTKRAEGIYDELEKRMPPEPQTPPPPDKNNPPPPDEKIEVGNVIKDKKGKYYIVTKVDYNTGEVETGPEISKREAAKRAPERPMY